jgi:gliding motility-associated-like protein
MMRLSRIALLLAITLLSVQAAFAFRSQEKKYFVAEAKVVGGTSGSGVITIAAEPLPNEAFYGKNVVIPVTVTADPGPIQTQNLKVEILFQLLDKDGQPMTGTAIEPVLLQRDPLNENALKGAALIARDRVGGIARGGRLHYFFRARETTGDVILEQAGIRRVPSAPGNDSGVSAAPFRTSVVTLSTAALSAEGSRVSVPDTFVGDGKTSVAFEAGSLSGPGTLLIRQEDPERYPAGPKGVKPAVVYSFELEGTKLEKAAQITLSYPADLDGKLTGSRANPTDLALYWLDRDRWRLLSRPNIDTTLHTVTATTPHFSTFALFASGAMTAADLRPTERIITPNGDGINDTATFSGLTADETVRIFDVRGRRIRSFNGPSAVWDGRDDDGDIVESGVYIYQFKSQGDRVSGVITVAK